jgi:hypothetical protein
MRLIYSCNQQPVTVGDAVTIRNQPATVLMITEPHKPSSTGRVLVQHEGSSGGFEYFPSVIGAEWIERGDL